MSLFEFIKENIKFIKNNYTDFYSFSSNLIIYQIKYNYLLNNLSL